MVVFSQTFRGLNRGKAEPGCAPPNAGLRVVVPAHIKPEERDLIRSLPLGIAAALLLALVALSTSPANNANAATNLKVIAGEGEPGYSINAFLPGDITVMKGDSVTWEWGWWEPHSVVFLAANTPLPSPEPPASAPGTEWPNAAGYVFSGLIFGDLANPPSFGPVVFPTVGDYPYFCSIHPKMTGTVKVVDTGDVDTQAELDARAAAELAPRLAAAKAVAAALTAAGVKVTPRSDGTSLYEAIVGGVTTAGDDAMQFFPATANLKVGDTLKWLNDTEVPHTVTFNAPPGPPQGDPFEFPQTPENTFGGTGFRHSGILWTVPAPNSYTSYELTFTAAGNFQYICILHAPQGMAGAVNVTAAATPTPTQTAAPQPPRTGTGGDTGGGTSPLWFLAIAGLIVGASGGTAAWATRR